MEDTLKSISTKVDHITEFGCSNLKLHEQRMHQMETLFSELKHNIEEGFKSVNNQMLALDIKITDSIAKIEDRSNRKFDKINNLVVGILVFTILLAFFAGVNVWEIARNYWK